VIRAHVDAVLARLGEDEILAGSTFDGDVPGQPERYCNVYVNNGVRDQSRFTGPQSRAEFTFTIHSVGTDRAQAQLVGERVFAQLLDWTPTVPGRQCFRMRHAVSQPVQKDPDTADPAYWYGVDQFDLISDPA
jgi:hypothetical protein